ncbi:MAG: MFS transporter [Gammaproteobacteria bacterium]|jgi:MHS family proline/betaine transporter-like MFS transporter
MQSDIPKVTPENKLILSCIIGNALEWYDFIIYGYFAPILGQLFFPAADRYSQLMCSFGALAAGFLTRPIGAVLFGHIGDKSSRIVVLMLSIYIMSIPTTLIGCLPTYEQIGWLAPFLLTLFRILQGLAIGGEYTSSMVFLVEHAPVNKRGFLGSWATCSLIIGVIIGSSVVTFIMHFLTKEQVLSFGWRIPFILSMFGCAIGIYVRRHLKDSKESFLHNKQQSSPSFIPIKELFNKYLDKILIVISLDALTAIGFFTLVIFLPSYFKEYLQISDTAAQCINTTNMIIFAVTTLMGGWISDQIGYKLTLFYPCLAFITISYFAFALFQSEGLLSIFTGQTILVCMMGIFFGAIPVTLAGLFPSEVRCSGISIAHNISMACFGGTAPLAATYLIQQTEHDLLSPSYLLIIGAVISLISIAFLSKKTIKDPMYI